MTGQTRGRASLVSASRIDVLLVLVLQGWLSTAAAERADAQEPLTFVYGNEVWIPGWTFYDGRDWLALHCDDRECRLVPAELTVKPSSWRGHYDDRSTSGQTLMFAKAGDSPGEVVAWIRRNEELTW